MNFEELDLNDNVLDSLYDMNFHKCTPVQEKCIPEILKGHDVLGVAQTGTGKTAAYLLPVLSKLDSGEYPEDSINCLIMAPTRELAQQIDQAMQGFSYYIDGVSSIAVYGGNDGTRYDQELKSLSLGADVVIATPGRLISHMSLGNVDFSKVSFFILDEADRMLDMGFSDDILKIAKYLPSTCQTIMFSATMPDKIEQLAKTLLKNPVEIKLAVSKPAEKIRQTAYVCYETQKMGIIKDIFKAGNLNRVIIFSGSKQKVKQINASLTQKHINSGEMHSDLDQASRDEMMFKFKSGKIDVLVATDILARGIDIDDITMVINYDVPRDSEDYVHRIGRTARADRNGCAITLVSESDIYYFQQIEKFLGITVEKMPLPEKLGESPEYIAMKGKTSAKSRRQKDRDKTAHKHKPRKRTDESGNNSVTKAEGDTDSRGGKTKPSKETRNKHEKQNDKKPARSQSAGNEKREERKPRRNNKNEASANEVAKEKRNRHQGKTVADNDANEVKKTKTRKKKPQTRKGSDKESKAKSKKYAISEHFAVKEKKVNPIKEILKKPLKWIKSLGKK